MKTSPKNRLLPLLLLAATSRLFAQNYPDSTLLVIKFYGSERLIGYVTGKTRDSVFFKNDAVGAIAIPRYRIRIITRYDSRSNHGQYWKNSPLEATTFFAPTGFGLRKGEGYFRTVAPLFNQVNYGLTDRFSFGPGLYLTPTLWKSSLSAKWNVPYRTGKASAAFGFGYLFKVQDLINHPEPELENRLTVFAVNSWGTRANQLSIGSGWFFHKNTGDNLNYFLTAAYLWRWRGKWAIITENQFVRTKKGFDVPISLGFRLFGKITTWDLGFVYDVHADFRPRSAFSFPSKTYTALLLPWMTLSIPFKKK